MATQLFLRGNSGDAPQQSQQDYGWGGSIGGSLATTRGSSTATRSTSSITGPTSGQNIPAADFVSDPVAADVTISGTVTCNIWASESDMNANVAINFEVDVLRAVDGSSETIVRSARTTEVGTSSAVNNFTATPGAGVTVNKGDIIRVYFFGDDAGTMAAGFTFAIWFSGPTGGADGDSFVTFTEDITFMTRSAGGSTLYLTDVASDVATASVDRVAWTSRDDGVVTDVLSTSGSAILQWTDTAGGTVVDWFTKKLEAFTLADLIECNISSQQSVNDFNMLRMEIAVVDGDGTNPTVYGTWMADTNSGNVGVFLEAPSVSAIKCWVSGDDISVAQGQRIRIRLNTDVQAQGSSRSSTCTLHYGSTTGGVTGDSWVRLNQTVTEFIDFVPGTPLHEGRGFLSWLAR